MSRVSAGKQLRTLLESGVMLPGAYDGLVARQAKAKNFKALYLSGAAISASYGVPDIGLLTLDHFKAKIREISVASGGLPILADADTGFGEVEMVSRVVREFAHAGAAGLHLEDQEFPKRCGHLDGKSLVSAASFIEKIKRAKSAADEDFVVCARTDARGVDGFEAAVERATLYVLEGGADMIFPEGLKDLAEFEKFAQEMNKLGAKKPYLLGNMTEFGKTDFIKFSDFVRVGYHGVIFPVSALRAATKNVELCFDQLAKEGSVEQFVNAGKMQTRHELYNLLGYTPGKEWTWQ